MADRINRVGRLKWIPIAQMKVNPAAQREINPAWVDHIAADLDPEAIGHPIVNHRDGYYWIVDGQHRIEALRQIGWGDQSVQCEVYEDLDEAAEAEEFLKRNSVKAVAALPKFKAAITAGRDEQCDIDRVVRAQGLVVSRDKVQGAIGAVGTLERVYRRSGPVVLGRALRIIRDAYGDPGLESAVIDGLALVCQRYNGELNDETAVKRLGDAHGGVGGLLSRAEVLRKQTGNAKAHCVGAAAVEFINRGKGGKKLPNWWAS